MASSAPRCAGGCGRDRAQLDGEDVAEELSSDTDPHHPVIENSLGSDDHDNHVIDLNEVTSGSGRYSLMSLQRAAACIIQTKNSYCNV